MSPAPPLNLATLSLTPLLALSALLAGGNPLAAQTGPMVAGATIRIPDSQGKFDFLAIDPVNHRLLAAHEKDGTADFIDLGSKTVLARVKTGPTVGIVRDPKTGNYFCSVQDDKRLAVIDPVTFKETASVALPAETDAILFDDKDRLVFVTNDNGTFVWAVNADTLKVAAAIPIPSAPECMAYDAGSDRIYLNLKAANEVAVIDLKTMGVVARWPTAPVAAPHGMAFDPATSRIFSAGGNGKLVSIDARTGKVVGSADITAKVDQIAFDDSTRHIYCAGADRMSVVQETPDGLKPIGTIKTAPNAKNVAVDPSTHDVWTTYTNGTDSFASSWTSP